MILGLKIGVGIVLGIALVHVVFWLCVLVICLLGELFERIGKWIK